MYYLRSFSFLLFTVGLITLTMLPLHNSSAQTPSRKKKSVQYKKNNYKHILSQLETGRLKNLPLSQIVRLILENSTTIRIHQLKILKLDTDLLKNDSFYTPKLESGWEKKQRKNRYTNSFTRGDTVNSDKIYLRAKKEFQTGTYFEAELSNNHVRSKTTADSAINSFSGDTSNIFSPATLHTSGLRVILRQELLKNAFGYSQRRSEQILKNKAKIERQDLIYNLGALVVESIIDFWELSIAEKNIETVRRLLANTRKIQSITARKRRLGLAESFEINQWNGLVATAQTNLEQAQLRYNGLRRSLLRSINLKTDVKLAKIIQLETQLPKDIDATSDLATAYNTRPDLKSLQLQKKNAQRRFEIASNELLPSLSIASKYIGHGYDPKYNKAIGHSFSNKYPEYSFELKMTYPLWDKGVQADARNAKIDLNTLIIEEQDLLREISDEIKQGIEEMQVARRAMKNAQKNLNSSRIFYAGILRRYRQGRFSADAVKNALDSLVRAEQNYTEAQINFNIVIVRYDLIRNTFFTQYDIDVNKALDRMIISKKKN